MFTNNCLRFSILTPSFNQGVYIEENIRSVLDQDWDNFEHIVIDGGSKDETTDVLRKFPHLIWKSESDDGQADALNKGLALASGDIVGWINSDDYYRKGAFKQVAQCFADPSVLWVVGNLSILDESNGEFVPFRSSEITKKSLETNPDILRQQATFFRKELLDSVGGWNKEYFMVMDFDLWMRLVNVIPPKMVNEEWAVFRIQKDQKSGLMNIVRQTNELVEILKREGASEKDIFSLKLKRSVHWIKGHIKVLLIKTGLLGAHYIHKPVRGWRKNNS
jgi:glycosyltransferase involved in cell wall biosynthesis